MTTYRDIIRSYARTVLAGYSDTDLTARQRKYTGIMLNLTANYGWSGVAYPPSDATREDTRAQLVKIASGDLRYLFTDGENADLNIAIERAQSVLANV